MDLYRPPWQLLRDAISGTGANHEQDLFRKIITEKIKANEMRRELKEQKRKLAATPKKNCEVMKCEPS